jgi:type VI secretion system protein ImpC
MSESIQKKLMRVRPPRVKITYDVETGGAIEKKELPFIVGILADLSGDRAEPENAPVLKERRMVDLDRDNFNDVMKKIGPRADLAPVLGQLPLLQQSKDPADKAIIFGSMDDFEPLAVVNALPSLRRMYHARAQIRSLQARAESDDSFALRLDKWLEDDDPVALDARQKALLACFGTIDNDGARVLREKLFALADKVTVDAAPDEATLGELKKWSLDPGADDASKQAAVSQGRTIVGMASAPASAENLGKAKDLLKLLAGDAPEAGSPAAARLDAVLAKLDYADRDAARKALQLDGVNPSDELKGAMQQKALLLLGAVDGVNPFDVDDDAYPDSRELAEARQHADARGAVLAYVSQLYNEQGGNGERLMLLKMARELSGQPDNADAVAAVIASMRYFVSQIVNALQDEQKAMLRAVKKGIISVIDEKVAGIDRDLSEALSVIMHSASFKDMESTWRGMSYLVSRAETGQMLKLRVFDATKEELRKDMEKAVEFDQSALFKLVYEAEYGTYGGFPYSLLVGGYEIGRSSGDIAFLKKIAEVAASAHAPFIAAASTELFSLSGFDQLDKPRDLKKRFESAELIEWREFRETEDSRYVSLVMPRVLLRLPYGLPEKRNTIPCEGLNFEEHVGAANLAPVFDDKGNFVSHPVPDNQNFLWGNPAYVLAERITNAFALYNWTAAIRGVEGGGLVEGLPAYTYTSDLGTTELLCPTEVSITDRREKELNDLGFIALCHCKGSAKAAFFGGQTTNSPKKYFSDEANANARISAMLPYMLAASRFAHYIKVIMREKIGSFLTRGNVETFLNGWISNYVLLDDNASQDVKAAYPLRAASVMVTEVPGEPGVYKATVFLKPHFQLEELSTSIRLVANLPA